MVLHSGDFVIHRSQQFLGANPAIRTLHGSFSAIMDESSRAMKPGGSQVRIQKFVRLCFKGVVVTSSFRNFRAYFSISLLLLHVVASHPCAPLMTLVVAALVLFDAVAAVLVLLLLLWLWQWWLHSWIIRGYILESSAYQIAWKVGWLLKNIYLRMCRDMLICNTPLGQCFIHNRSLLYFIVRRSRSRRCEQL